MHILRLAALPLALGLALSACLDPDTITSANPTASTALAGGVAFHLSGADSLALVGKADSVRIEASRSGYPTHSVSGSLLGTTRLSDLEPGLWNLKIALYNANLTISWAGDTTVTITSGITADAVVRLHPATGSVNVRIILDSTIANPTANDTLPVGYAAWTNDATWSALKAWRTRDGIYLTAAPNCAFKPEVRLGSIALGCASAQYCISPAVPVTDSSTLVLGGVSDPLIDCVLSFVALPPLTHFVPWTRRGTVTLHTSTGDVILQDPRNTEQEPTDSSFFSYSYSISGFMPTATSYTMDATGKVKSISTHVKGIAVDTTPIITYGSLHPDSLAIALSILQSSAVRHPAPLIELPIADSNGLVMGCPTDFPYYSRKISYTNGETADLSWSYSNYCGTLPTGWKDLNRVDNMLQSLLPALMRAIPIAVNDGSNE